MEPIGDSVRRLRPGDPTASAAALSAIARVWPSAVGDAIARAAWPARIARDGTLHVATASSTWAFELTALAPEIAERLASALGPDAPPALRFAPGHLPAPGAGAAERMPATPPAPTAADRSTAAGLAAAIEDEELRRHVARAAAASLARHRASRGF